MFKDAHGVEVKAGDFVVYPRSVGDISSLAFAKVLYSTSKKKTLFEGASHSLRVVGVADGWYSDRPTLQKPYSLRYGYYSRRGCSEKVLILPRKLVPARILKLLDKVDLADYPKERA